MRNLSRGVALFLALFTAVSAWIAVRGGEDPNLWWLDLRALPPFVAGAFFAMVIAALLVAFRGADGWWQGSAVAVLVVAIVVALLNAITFYRLLRAGVIGSAMPVPFSLLVACAFAMVAWSLFARETTNAKVILFGFMIAAGTFPLLQVLCFGLTDYRRPADVIVVFGARAYADGTPSGPLGDRVRTACALYRAGYAPKLLFSGGPGDGAIDEPHAMSRMAQRLGVPASAILLDPHGLNTDATARNTRAMLHNPRTRVLAVSHFYHLPRIKLAFQRAGMDVWTVPCETTARSQLVYNVPRECVAFWAYYLRWLTAR